ncbi:MAG: BamA/TamA family outer membrane protein [candidate division KSB1 bacterium]|nr:BamA/TamA family outer membrane protein [candidate division KSB1 bacterium]
MKSRSRLSVNIPAIVLLAFWLAFGRVVALWSQPDTTRLHISQIDIQGRISLSPKEFQKAIPPGSYTSAELTAAILNLLQEYQRRGLYFTRIAASDSAQRLRLHINEGAQLLLKEISLQSSDTVLVERLAPLLDIRQTRTIDDALIFNIEELLKYLENHGYPFAAVIIGDFEIEQKVDSLHQELTFRLQVDPGPYVAIDSIVVQGNALTKTAVVLRAMRWKPGEIFSQQRVERMRERLLRTGYFSEVESPQIQLTNQGRGHLVVALKEGNPNQLQAVLGYSPGTPRQPKGYLTGVVDVAMGNLLGTGRTLEAYWSRKDPRSQELRFRYLEPWVLGSPLHAGAGFQQTIQDTSFVRRQISLDVSLPYSDALLIGTSVGSEEVLPDSMGQALYHLPQSNAYLVRLSLSYDSRNDPWNPVRGVYYGTQYEFARKKVARFTSSDATTIVGGRFRRERWRLDGELYLPTFRWQTLLLGLHGKQITSTEQPISVADLFRFGGTGTLRGYREDEFWGEKIAWVNIEYRYLLAPRSRVFVFFDAGYFTRSDESRQAIEDHKFGYGLGLRLDTRLGVLGIDYGLGEGRGLGSGLVHIGLMNKF